MKNYTVHKLNLRSVDGDVVSYLMDASERLRAKEGTEYNKKMISALNYMMRPGNHVWICRKGKELVGFLAASISLSNFDGTTRLLYQDILFAEEGTFAAKYLLDSFIDFGKKNADHILTVIGTGTNIKERSLERLGFQKLETVYRIEVNDGEN